MKALVKEFPKPGLWLTEVPVPEVGPDDVLIKIHKTAICGTDVHIYNWDEWAQRTIPIPMVIGHEFVGEVVGFGENVKGIKMKRIVSGEGHIVCGFCRNCRAGRQHLCRNTKGVGVNRAGCFAEFLSIPKSNVWVCDPSIPEELYCFFDPFGNAVHSALQSDLTGEDVLITGAGPIGIMAAAVCQHAGARHVVILNRGEYRRNLAKKMGIKNVYDPRIITIKEIMRELGMKEGFDVGLEMSGSSNAFNEMVDHMTHGGKISLLAMQAPGTFINWDKVVFNMLTIKGIYGREMYETWHKMTAFLQAGLDISPMITHRFEYTDFDKGFEAMNSGESGKVILNWNGA